MRKTAGIDTSVKAGMDTPFPVTEENFKHFATLHSVAYVHDTDKNDEEFDALDFVFVSPDGNYKFSHREFGVKEDDAKYADKCQWCDQRIAHIFNAFMGDNAHVNVGGHPLGTPEAEGDLSWGGYFAAVARDFNNANKGHAVFKNAKGEFTVMWLKLTYSQRGYLQLPFPNFIEKYVQGRESLLYKGKTESFKAPKKDEAIGGGAAAGGTAIKPTSGMPPGF